MFSSNTSSSGGGASDPQFNYVTMLLHGDGTNGAQNNTFLDSSTNAFTITRNGNTTQGTFTPYGSNWSNFFDGSSYFSNIGTTSSFNFMHQSSALWTCECFVFVTSLSAALYLIDNTDGTSGQTGVNIYIGTDGKINLFITSGSGGGVGVCTGVSSSGIQANTWNHIVVTYDQSLSSNNAKFYINGASVGTATKGPNTPSAGNASQTMRIGAVPGAPSNNFRGYISNLRITNSIVYSSAFTPPTTPLTAIANTALLFCQSNRFIDNSSNAFTFVISGSPSVQRFSPFNPTAPYSAATIGGSGYFDGSGDTLSAPDNAALEFGSGNFTIEAFFYTTSTSSQTIIAKWATSNLSWFLGFGSGLGFYINVGAGGVLALPLSSVPANQWNHIAVTRSGADLKLFLNGTQSGSTYNIGSSTILDTSATVVVAGDGSGNPEFVGYISNVRILKGTAQYTANFTPPSAPLTAITNTSLLLNFTNGGIIDNAMMNDLETVGNAQISTAQSRFGGGSMFFDGSGDYLQLQPNSPNFNFGPGGDYTIEAWVYPTLIKSVAINPVFQTADQGNEGLIFGIDGGFFNVGRLILYEGSSFYSQSGSTTVSTNTWTHIAVSRQSGVTRFFISGVQVGSVTYSYASTKFGNPRVGSNSSDASATFQGYIDDLRITKGYARYTANFTPPAAPFPDQ